MTKRILDIAGIGLALLLAVVSAASCTGARTRYKIGVSQCSDDIWRHKLNQEIRTSAYLYDGVKLHFASAYDNDERQVQQIDSLLRLGIDLLVVAPNQVQALSPAIDRVFDKGIPVIVIDRKTNSQKYSAYIGADNFEMGRQMGEYIAAQLQGKGRVVEIMGLEGSSPAIDRHRGFADAIGRYPQIQVIATLQGDWTGESAMRAMKAWEGDLSDVDAVFGQNDRMAMGAREVLGDGPLYFGIDGLPGENGGIRQVQDSLLACSYVYPTRGDLVMQLAMNILEGRPFDRDNLLRSTFVTAANAEVMLLEAEEMDAQATQLNTLHDKVDWYTTLYRHQQIYSILLGIIILLIAFGAWYALRTMKERHELEREAFALVVSEEKPVEQTPEAPEQAAAPTEESPFLEQLRLLVHENMGDSEFSVETLADKMNLSRVQFYRKVKQLTGRTPVDIIRQSRLNRAKVLLETTDKNVSEVAYEVGFSAPSYFTKCFKDEFGVSPSDL